ETWELIGTVADANQHFNRRATSKGVYEVAPSDSTVLAKSLVDIVAMLKEIKEGQQVTPTLLKRQPDDWQQKPVKHCGICSCNSHQTDECPQLQEDNTVASAHNFYDATIIPPYNRQYYTQGGRDNQPSCWIPPQHKEAKGEKEEDENEEGSVSWWYNLLAQLVDSDDEEDEESRDESEEEDEDESTVDSEDEYAEEEEQTEEEESEDEEEVYNKRTSFIVTLFNNKEIKEEVPVKCEDRGPCLVPCRIKGVEVRECLCDPGACSNVMPYELYKFLKLGTLKKTKEIFTTADASIVSVVGIA
ncbi:hypothetical protein PIB30_100237, partial [Stylosanthes scabra]|nr:hypothetical protein [Stylosanthes scabra]